MTLLRKAPHERARSFGISMARFCQIVRTSSEKVSLHPLARTSSILGRCHPILGLPNPRIEQRSRPLSRHHPGTDQTWDSVIQRSPPLPPNLPPRIPLPMRPVSRLSLLRASPRYLAWGPRGRPPPPSRQITLTLARSQSRRFRPKISPRLLSSTRRPQPLLQRRPRLPLGRHLMATQMLRPVSTAWVAMTPWRASFENLSQTGLSPKDGHPSREVPDIAQFIRHPTHLPPAAKRSSGPLPKSEAPLRSMRVLSSPATLKTSRED